MRFSAIHKVASYLMVAAAFASLALSRELPPLIVALTALLGLGSFFFEPQRHAFLRTRSWTFAWNAATVVTFAWTLLDALRGEALFAGVRFLCFLLVNKLWNRRASRDYLQAYVVSFLMLVAGAALSSELAYAGCFLAYVVFATWTLTLFHLFGLLLELFKTNPAIGSWSYPEPGLAKIAGVPLYSGFMYAAVASYMIQAWRLFDLEIVGLPPARVAVPIALLIYLNFFTHHWLGDYRWWLALLLMVCYRKT